MRATHLRWIGVVIGANVWLTACARRDAARNDSGIAKATDTAAKAGAAVGATAAAAARVAGGAAAGASAVTQADTLGRKPTRHTSP